MSNRLEELQLERTQLMSGQRTHGEWVKVLERLAEISAEVLMLSNDPTPLPKVDGLQGDWKMPIGQPPLTTHSERIMAQQKLNRMNEFINGMKHGVI